MAKYPTTSGAKVSADDPDRLFWYSSLCVAWTDTCREGEGMTCKKCGTHRCVDVLSIAGVQWVPLCMYCRNQLHRRYALDPDHLKWRVTEMARIAVDKSKPYYQLVGEDERAKWNFVRKVFKEFFGEEI